MEEVSGTKGQHLDDGNGEAPDASAPETIPLTRPYLWVTGQSDWEDRVVKFSGFEPCYIACIKDLEWKISRKVQMMKPGEDNPGLADEMRPLLLEYSQLLEALSQMESRQKIFEEDEPEIFRKQDRLSQYAGVRRRITRHDDDRVHDSLRNNIFFIVLNYIYQLDTADRLKRRFGNLTQTADRILVGIAGGASLLVPMIVMSFVESRNSRLIIVSVATIAFAAVIGTASASRDSVVSATAAYAAVMVVYIGTSGQGQ